MGSSGSTSPYTTQPTPIVAPSMMETNFQCQYSPTDGILESSSPKDGDIAQRTGLGTWMNILENEYDAATLPVQADPLEATESYFPLSSWEDVTYAHSDRSSSEDKSTFMATPSAVTSQLQSHPVGSSQGSELAVVRHDSPWNSSDASVCFGPMQWAEYMPSIEHESFASSCHVHGTPMFFLNMTPSDTYLMMDEMENRLDQRMGSLYGDPGTYDKVCSRKFGSTLAEWYREDVRQLAHCVSDCHSNVQALGC
ncbi:hypothetical protein P171DRAFT_14153 [Karstenula rhodostoma CBS 690.94]|uniref:Uncharacterized protein n=1 Tax=Karstenula rhodostoma CBS 690.94 TaxID=1392251 RepID=A0A9P4PZ42_9PLEO|nr:hypothetical protein P171DRAFT_14153 [Karstenula rhodostoma CBS 690.94]